MSDSIQKQKQKHYQIYGKDLEEYRQLTSKTYFDTTGSEMETSSITGFMAQKLHNLTKAQRARLTVVQGQSIEWMAVDNEFQSQLIGGELLFEIFDIAAATGVERVHAVIHDQYEKAKICRGADKYFRQHIFYEEKAIGDDVLTDLGTIAKSKFMKKPVVEMMPTVLSQVSKKDRHDILPTLAGKKDAICFFDLMSISGGLDDDISIVFYHNDTIVGGLLVYDAGSVLIPVYLWRKADEVFNPLVIYCFKLTAKKYDRPKKVLVTQRDDRMPAIAKKVLGESSKASLLTASVEEYKSLDTKPE